MYNSCIRSRSYAPTSLRTKNPKTNNLENSGIKVKIKHEQVTRKTANICISKQQTSVHPISSVQFSSVAQLCPTLCDPMNCSTPGLPVHHQLPEFTRTHVHRVTNYLEQIGGGKLLYMIAHFATTNSSSLCGSVQEKLVES